MSLMNTMTKMAIGFAMAKGMEAVQRRGGIGAVMEELSGAVSGGGGREAGLGGLLGQLGGSARQAGMGGGLGDLLGQLAGGAGSGAGGAGSLGALGGLLGGLAGARGGAGGAAFEDLLNADNPPDAPDEEEVAHLMLRAMTQAARADGDIDAGEKARLVEVLREGDPQDVEVLQTLLEEPVNAHALASATPRGLETQVYTMSLNAISPDHAAEARYLHDLAEGLGLAPERVNGIHDGLGVPRLYR